MTRFLQSASNPAGFKLEELLVALRGDVLERALEMVHDDRPAAQRAMANSMKILVHLTEAAALAQDSTLALENGFGREAVAGEARAAAH